MPVNATVIRQINTAPQTEVPLADTRVRGGLQEGGRGLRTSLWGVLMCPLTKPSGEVKEVLEHKLKIQVKLTVPQN